MMQLTLNRIARIRALAIAVFLAALMAASLTLAAHPAHASTTFTVDSTADYGDQTPETASATQAPRPSGAG
jgi:hypothetical protein